MWLKSGRRHGVEPGAIDAGQDARPASRAIVRGCARPTPPVVGCCDLQYASHNGSIGGRSAWRTCLDLATGSAPRRILYICEPLVGLKALVVVDNTAAGPAIGGTRMAPDVSTEECFRLARAMTLKNAAAGLAHGGGKSVIFGDPSMPRTDYERRVRAFAAAIRNLKEYIHGVRPRDTSGTHTAGHDPAPHHNLWHHKGRRRAAQARTCRTGTGDAAGATPRRAVDGAGYRAHISHRDTPAAGRNPRYRPQLSRRPEGTTRRFASRTRQTIHPRTLTRPLLRCVMPLDDQEDHLHALRVE